MADSYSGFELVVENESFAGSGDADYHLFINKDDAGETVVRIIASANQLTASTLALRYDQALYQPVRGNYGEWPEDSGIVRQSANMGARGAVQYSAEVLNTAGASGGIPMVTLVFSNAAHVAAERENQQTSLLDPQQQRPQQLPQPQLQQQPAQDQARLAPPARPASANNWPRDKNELRWLNQYYLSLPRLDSQYSVYTSRQEQDWADEVFRLTNQERRDKKHTPLKRDSHLDAIAQAMAKHMAEDGFFDHVNPLGLDAFDRIDCTDAPEWWSAGENIAAGYRGPQQAHKGWMDSSGHKKNIRNEKYRYMGVGVYHAPGTSMEWFWVQVFATFDEDPLSHDWIDPGEFQP